MDVTVVVGSFGGIEWSDLAESRAIPSVEAMGVRSIHSMGDTLHDARNWGLHLVETEFVCFLDADDELEPGYFEAMGQGTADLRAPSVRYVGKRVITKGPYMPRVAGHDHTCEPECLAYGNWLVIGTVARTSLLRSVGGFRDLPIYEDWDLWLRCWQTGASVEAIPDAVYRAHVRADSRNRGPSREAKHATHQAIAQANGVPAPA